MSEGHMLSEIAVEVGKLKVLQENTNQAMGNMASSIDRLVAKLGESDDIAREAIQSARSAHHRIDGLNEQIIRSEDDLSKKVTKVEEDFKWIWKTALGAIIAGAIGLLFGLAKIFLN